MIRPWEFGHFYFTRSQVKRTVTVHAIIDKMGKDSTDHQIRFCLIVEERVESRQLAVDSRIALT